MSVNKPIIASMNNLNANNLFELALCWCLWLFGTFLNELTHFCSTSYGFFHDLISPIMLVNFNVFDFSLFETLQVTSFLIAIVVGIVNLLKALGFNVNLKKRWFKGK